jgi:hypothetical protein
MMLIHSEETPCQRNTAVLLDASKEVVVEVNVDKTVIVVLSLTNHNCIYEVIISGCNSGND